MKKLILTGLTLLFAITLTFAQNINPETKAKEAVAELTEKLTLTETQQATIHPIVLEKLTAKAAVKSDTTLSKENAKQEIQKLQAVANGKINEVLTEEQRPVFAKYLEEKTSKKMD